MRIEQTIALPVSRKKAYDYLIDPRTWQYWFAGMIEVLDLEHARWEVPGDEIRFVYRLLGRRVEGEIRLEENRPAELVKVHVTAPGVGTILQEWDYAGDDADTFTLTVGYETEPRTTFFGKVVDRTVVPRALERDLKATLGNLEGIFTVGPPD